MTVTGPKIGITNLTTSDFLAASHVDETEEKSVQPTTNNKVPIIMQIDQDIPQFTGNLTDKE